MHAFSNESYHHHLMILIFKFKRNQKYIHILAIQVKRLIDNKYKIINSKNSSGDCTEPDVSSLGTKLIDHFFWK